MVDFIRDSDKKVGTHQADEHQVLQSAAPLGTTTGSASMGRYNTAPNPLTQAAYDGKPHVTTNREIFQMSDSAFQGMAEQLPLLALTSSLPVSVAVRAFLAFAGCFPKLFDKAYPWVQRVQQYMARGSVTREEAAKAEQGVEKTFSEFEAAFREEPRLVDVFKRLCEAVKQDIQHGEGIGKTVEESANAVRTFGPKSLR